MKKIFSANVIDTGARWLVLTLILKFYGTELFGVYSYVMAVATPVFIFANFSLRNICATDIEGRYPIGAMLSLRVLANLIGSALCCSIVLWVNKSYLSIAILFSAIKCIEGVADIFSGYQQRDGRYGVTSLGLSSRAALSLVAIGVALGLRLSLEMAFGMQAVFWASSVCLVEYRAFVKENGAIQSFAIGLQTFKSLIGGGLSLAVSAAIISITVNLPRYFLESHTSLKILGIISGYLNTIRIGNIFVSSLGYVSLSTLSRKWYENQLGQFYRIVRKSLLRISLASAVLVLMCILFRKYIVLILFNKDYLEVSYFLIYVSVLAYFNYIASFLGVVANAIKIYKVILLVNASALVLSGLVGFATINLLDPYLFTSLLWLLPFLLQIVCFGAAIRKNVANRKRVTG